MAIEWQLKCGVTNGDHFPVRLMGIFTLLNLTNRAMKPCLIFFSIASIVLPLSSVTASDSVIDFARDIKPILSDKCYACHGPDAGQREGGGEDGLRFDTEEGALVDLGGYRAIVAGDLESSELFNRITSDDPDLVMPPSEHTKSLSKSEIEKLSQWIKQGAQWSIHWSYRPLNKNVAREGNWIDRLVRDKLASVDVEASAPATDSILLRRIYFDLIGLPPTPKQFDAFQKAQPDNRWSEVIDQLLASPHFGERMAIYWLDLVRYADTVGYHGDQDVSVSPYRDYVIQAFNQNLPFDQFTREQLAGDLLPEANDQQRIASGYNRLGMMSAEGGAQPKEYLTKYASDRVRTASTVWLGSTLGCAECHDHKFDPFTQADFYKFASYFADIQERGLYAGANRDGKWGPSIDVADADLPERLRPLEMERQKLQETYESAEIDQSLQKWIAEHQTPSSQWESPAPSSLTALNETNLTVKDDQSILASGPGSETNTYTLSYELNLESALTGLRIEALPDPSLPANGPGRAGNGNFVVSEVKVELIDNETDAKPLELKNARASFEQADGNQNPYKGWKAIAAIDNDSKSWGWAVMPQFGVRNAWIAELSAPVKLQAGSQVRVTIEQNHQNPGHTLGHFRVSFTDQKVDFDSRQNLPREVLAIIDKKPDDRQDAEQKQLQDYYRGIAAELDSVRNSIKEIDRKIADTKARHTRTTLVTVAVPPRSMRVLPRGNWMDDSGPEVQPLPPHFLPQKASDRRQTRLDLANWIVATDNPLTARVFVNRLWKLFFGTGLSKVLDDLGSQGEYPSHPELLDALALEFIESGWDIKHIIRLVVLSETYQQASLPRESLKDLDPYNRLLARQARFRLDAEMIRDNALAVSGLLVNELGGRSVKPYQPAGLLRHLNFPTRTYKADAGDNQYRRGVYTHWQRQFLHPAMKLFDAPAREECTAERPRSNTPLAALLMLNDPSYVEAARVFAENALTLPEIDDRQRLSHIFSHALTRQPTDQELDILVALRQQQAKHYAQRPDQAAALVNIGDRPAAAGLDHITLASYVAVTRTILNMHEFITRN